MLHFALCDDEEASRALVRETLARIPGYRRAADLHLGEYCRGEALLADIEEGFERFDLIVLDVYMDGLTGVETARRLRATGDFTPIVFLTTSPNFGVEAFEVEAAGYLLKPVEEGKLAALLGKVFSPTRRPRVVLQCGRERRYFDLDNILYAESAAHVTVLHLYGGEIVSCGEKLGNLETLFGDERFLRCHQSFLVNLEYVADAREAFILDDGTCIPIPVRRRREITDAYYRYFVTTAVGRGKKKEDSYV